MKDFLNHDVFLMGGSRKKIDEVVDFPQIVLCCCLFCFTTAATAISSAFKLLKAVEISVAAVVKQNSQQNDRIWLPNIVKTLLLDPGQG